MKERIAEKIKSIPFYGILDFTETKRFYDDNFSSKENLFQFRLSKIHLFIGDKNKILGIQSFYKNLKNEEFPGKIGYNESIKELKIIKFEIPSNDYLCYMNIYKTDEEGIKRLKFRTKKGKELEVGEGGDDSKVSNVNKNQENIILSISGGYNKQLSLLSCRFININDYFGNSIGYFELRIKMKDEKFKDNVESNINRYEDSYKVLGRKKLF